MSIGWLLKYSSDLFPLLKKMACFVLIIGKDPLVSVISTNPTPVIHICFGKSNPVLTSHKIYNFRYLQLLKEENKKNARVTSTFWLYFLVGILCVVQSVCLTAWNWQGYQYVARHRGALPPPATVEVTYITSKQTGCKKSRFEKTR